MSTQPVFIPPTFANIGKAYKDLYKKKFDFDNVAKVVNKTPFGLTLTSSFKVQPNDISAISKAEYKNVNYADFEGEADTGSGKVYGKVIKSFKEKGVKVTIGGGFDPASKDKLVKENWSAKVEAEYQKDAFQVGLSTLVGNVGDKIAEAVEVSAVAGIDGLAVGGQVKLRVDQEKLVEDYNVGAQWQKHGFIFGLNTEQKGDIINVNTYYPASDHWVVGAELSANEAAEDPKKRRIFSFATQFTLDKSTAYKLRANTLGEVSAAVEHRLANPAILINGAAQFKANGLSPLKTEKFGVNLTVGDF